jgi:hypothetical protein
MSGSSSTMTPSTLCGDRTCSHGGPGWRGGEILQRVELDCPAFSVALGGPTGRTLLIVANEWNGTENIGKGLRTGVVYTTEVDVPAA